MTGPVPCPVCTSVVSSTPVHTVENAPVNSVVIIRDPDSARSFPTGSISLRYCNQCGFAWNAHFDLDAVHYGEGYESTQAFSPAFNAYHERLAQDLVERHRLEGATVVEIGCGQGEFLHLLQDSGVGTCIGYDPAFDPRRPGTRKRHGVDIDPHLFQDVGGMPANTKLVCCKMTLEHIPNVAEFLTDLRERVSTGTTVMIQVPNFAKILSDAAFWDVYYEHCSYFTPNALKAALELADFTVDKTWTDYNGQYLYAEASPTGPAKPDSARSASAAETLPSVENFAQRVRSEASRWRATVAGAAGPVVCWGGGSKAVAFLSSLGAEAGSVVAAADVNPLKNGTFLPGTATPVLAPEGLTDISPSMVALMNPIYRTEVERDLERIGLGDVELFGLGEGHTAERPVRR